MVPNDASGVTEGHTRVRLPSGESRAASGRRPVAAAAVRGAGPPPRGAPRGEKGARTDRTMPTAAG